jgi:uroporphyrinogen decarboxylase
MSLTPKERVIAQIEHKETDYLPYVIEFERDYDIEAKVDAYYGSDQWRTLIENHIVRIRVVSDNFWTRKPDPPEYWTDLFGTVWRTRPRPRHPVKPALKEPTLENYSFPTVEDCFDSGWEELAYREIQANQKRFIVADVASGLFERAWMMRGYENALMDVALHRDFYEELVDKIMRLQMQMLDRLLGLPIDGIFFIDDWGYQQGVTVGAKRWREIFKPRYAQMYAKVHAAGKYTLSHSCGGIEEILSDAIEVGLDVYESVQPEAKNNSPYQLKQRYGDQISFWGGLGSQSTIPFGTPDSIRDEVTRLVREMGRGGGYILAPAKPIQPETPIENIIAIIESFLEQAGKPFPKKVQQTEVIHGQGSR